MSVWYTSPSAVNWYTWGVCRRGGKSYIMGDLILWSGVCGCPPRHSAPEQDV